MNQQVNISGISKVNQRGKRLQSLNVMQCEGPLSLKLGVQFSVSPR